MPSSAGDWRFLGSRLAHRLFALFVLAALVPLGLSDWLSSTAVNQLAETLNLQSRARVTRQVSRQVFDRLLTAKTLLRALPPSAPPPGARLPGVGQVFHHLTLMDADGRVVWSTAAASDLARTWAAASQRAVDRSAGSSAAMPQAGAGRTVELRAFALPGPSAAILLSIAEDGGARWIATMNPAFLWAPVADALDDTAWRVLNTQGQTLFSTNADAMPRAAAHQAAGASPADPADFRFRLFLRGEFGTPDWVFVQSTPPRRVVWQGWPLPLWLGLVAAATLLLIALLAQWQIRRMLGPLEQLTQGTRKLAAGDIGTRVNVGSADEIGMLAEAFNDMAARIGAQFNALEGLAAIDRDILTGAAMERLAGRLLDRLRALYPAAYASIVWQHDRRTLRLALLPGYGQADPATALQTRDTVLDEQTAMAWEQLQHDTQCTARNVAGTGDVARRPWLHAALESGLEWLAILPLRERERVRALIAIALPAPLAPEQLQPAHELRDRLAVAFAARAREHELVHQATHDSLTGLVNRHGLHDRLDALLSALPPPATLAVLYIDLDHFKDVNDSRGHEAGDVLLCQAGTRLRGCVPADAIVARQGGDEFTIVLPHADAAAARAVADAAVERLAQPFALLGSEHRVGASVGIALSPPHGVTRDELMRCADVALYAAKAAGRSRATFFDPAIDAQVREHAALTVDLHHAIEHGEFVVFYQPRVRASDGAMFSAEALIRWRHPRRGLLGPDCFIALAESSGLIGIIGAWMLDAACRQIATWRLQGLGLRRLSVNVSPQQLTQGDLLEQVRAVLQRHNVPATALELEITESLLVGDNAHAFTQLAALRNMGVSIALDDFGTGYASMAALRKMPLDVLKVDRSFVTDLETDSAALPVIRAIIALGKAGHLHLVAEGVETEQQAKLLRDLGCDELQGFLYCEPVPPEKFSRLPGLGRG